MNKKYLVLAGRLREELQEIEKLIDRTEQGWLRAKSTGDDLYLDGVALNLHGIYTGFERIFELIATHIDQTRPEGKNWHHELLRQMAAEIPMVRPPVISIESRNLLDELRGFRHVVRNVYAFNFDAAKIERLVDNLSSFVSGIKTEIQKFCGFLEKVNKGSNP